MDKMLKTLSLLPWLDPGTAKVYLEISLKPEFSQDPDLPDIPFQLLDSTSPLFQLIHAAYKIPAGRPVKEVFLLVQKDSCSLSDSHMALTNPQIDRIWQEAAGPAGSDACFESLGAVDAGLPGAEAFPLWRSLFYCRHQGRYFHPPCPQCGGLLELCCDDEILSAAGLPLYSNSPERFLYCQVCHAGQADINFFNNQSGDYHQAKVKGCQALITGFGQLIERGMAGEDFPCRTCPDQSECSGSELPFSRIRPLAFYPFRMLITEAAQLPAREFLFLLSGAGWEELKQQPYLMREAGRVACLEKLLGQGKDGTRLFFANDSREFLEIFYLKLALLDQLARTALMAGEHLRHPDLRLTMDQFWVDFPRFQGLLPAFWNFTLKPIALGMAPPENISFVRVPSSFTFYSFSLLWFNALLVNSRQSAGDVQQALALLLESTDGAEPQFGASELDKRKVFEPENIFWLPGPRQIAPSWLGAWQKALGLGWRLLQASFQMDKNVAASFISELGLLAEEVKEMLFAVPSAVPVQAAPVNYDEDILGILLSLRDRWQEEALEEQNLTAAAPQPESEEKGSDSGEVEQMPAEQELEPEPEAEPEEELEKTVILSADQLAAMMNHGEPPAGDTGARQQDSQEIGPADIDGDDLEKTVIMNVNDLNSLLKKQNGAGSVAKPEQTVGRQPGNEGDDDLSETVMISQEDLQKLRKGKNGRK